jgi:hypothetical protein
MPAGTGDTGLLARGTGLHLGGSTVLCAGRIARGSRGCMALPATCRIAAGMVTFSAS